MGAPDQVNARNYGSDYYVVISPAGSELKMDQIRHTYLHYLLDPLALKYPDGYETARSSARFGEGSAHGRSV